MTNPFRTKSLALIKAELSQTEFKKNLGILDLVLLGLGGIIGTGIFVLTGLAAAEYAGPAITLSFLLGAVACIFTALAYAELAAMLPTAGGGYTYIYVSLGEVFAAAVGWLMLMTFTFGTATVAAGWSGYMAGILKAMRLELPAAWHQIPSEGGMVNLPAMFIIALMTLIQIKGAKGAARLNGLLVFVKLGAILIFLVAAIPHFDFANWEDFSPNGTYGIIAGAGFIFMAYTGFDTVATAAEECKNPNRDLPLGIIFSLLGSALLYILVAGVLTGIVPYASLKNPEPMTFALRAIGVQTGAKIVATGAVAGMTTVILTLIFGQSRILFVMARDGLLPPLFMRLHPRSNTPALSIMISGAVMALIAGFAPVSALGQIASMSSLATYCFVSIGLMVLRVRYPLEKRPFRCPAVFLTASASALICGVMFIQLFLRNWQPFSAAVSIGLLIYLVYGHWHSKLEHSA